MSNPGASRNAASPARVPLGPAIDLVRMIGAAGPKHNPSEELARGITALSLGRVDRCGSSSLRIRNPGASRALRVVVLGSHDPLRLAPALTPNVPAPTGSLRGCGVASQSGPLLAALCGIADAAASDPSGIDLTALSVGVGDTLAGVSDEVDDADLIICTEAVAWDPERPTITTGARGRLEADITIRSAASINDRAYAGSSLTPLNRLIERIAALRDDSGRITLPGFYDRATPPDRGALAALRDDWHEAIGAARPSGRLPLVERATQWPTLSVLSIDASDAGRASTPSTATARIAVSLVPDQRPVDIERALRQWLDDAVPDTLHAAIRVTESSRPYRSEPGDPHVQLHTDAVRRVFGRTPLAIGAGGMIGAGELHFRCNAPVLHAGIAGPYQRWGTVDEVLPPGLFDQGREVVAQVINGALRQHRS